MSKLVNQSRLQQFATKLWEKIKGKYNEALNGATLSEGTSPDKKITFTRISGENSFDVNLKDYTRLQDRNEFKEDVSADNVAIIDNSNIGRTSTVTSQNRGLGYRRLTTKAFKDGYVNHIKVYMDDSLPANTATTWKVWAITKDGTNKSGDRVKELLHSAQSINVESVTENGQEKRVVNIPVKKAYLEETYFIIKCTTHDMLVATNIKQEYESDVVNLTVNQPPDTVGSEIDWRSNAIGNTAIMYLYGRESIGSLSAKLDKVNSDSSTYVKHSDCTVEGGQQAHSGKVVKLDGQGKLSESILPSIAINEYIEVATFDHATLRNQRYENGDVVVVTSGGQVVKRYLCINKLKNPDNLTEGFVELNAKDGVVTSVEGKTGAVTLNIALEENKFKLKINGTGGTETVKEIEMISEAEIDSIINGLPN